MLLLLLPPHLLLLLCLLRLIDCQLAFDCLLLLQQVFQDGLSAVQVAVRGHHWVLQAQCEVLGGLPCCECFLFEHRQHDDAVPTVTSAASSSSLAAGSGCAR
eukprot:GHRQ01040060.1.p1 GENE.GHRQ01040060.1~~GHRQ01040060.1.p1  ORF type:complete len:102 (-),score=23.45 GHRQ01040060.1:338-643(-)